MWYIIITIIFIMFASSLLFLLVNDKFKKKNFVAVKCVIADK